MAYRHMIKEYEILKMYGEEFRKQIIQLKRQGLKTEPAFGVLLGLKNDPYIELLNYQIKILRQIQISFQLFCLTVGRLLFFCLSVHKRLSQKYF